MHGVKKNYIHVKSILLLTSAVGRKALWQLPVSTRQMIWVREYLKTGNRVRACEATAVSVGAVRDWFAEHPAFLEYLESQRKKLADATQYDLRAAIKELDEAIQFAKDTENANAYAKLIELKMKGYGLLIEKHDVRQFSSFSISIAGVDTPLAIEKVVEALPLSSGQEIDEEAVWK